MSRSAELDSLSVVLIQLFPKSGALELEFWKRNDREIENISSYDKSRSSGSAQQANFLTGVPTGRIIVASVWEKVYQLQLLGEDAKLALESIGSALICSMAYVKPAQLLV